MTYRSHWTVTGLALVVLCIPATGLQAGQQQRQPPQQPQPQHEPAQQGPQQQKALTVTLTGLSEIESREVYESVLQHAFFQMDYEAGQKKETARTEHLTEYEYLSKTMPDSSTRKLLVGLALYAAQHNQLFLWGETVKGEQAAGPNPDLQALQSRVAETMKTIGTVQKKFQPRELELEIYQVSYTTPADCVEALGTFGYNTGQPKGTVDLNQLPLVWPMKDSKRAQVATGAAGQGGRGGVTGPLADATTVGPQNRLAILYHRTQGGEVMEIKRMIREKLDTPARQVLIESLILEITEDGMKKLGVEWDWEDRVGEVKGEFSPYEPNAGLVMSFDEYSGKTVDVLKGKLKALIEERKAEVLSSPSVLALNNSQATIRVGRRIPIITELRPQQYYFSKVDIRYEPVGITLNIKPRVSQDGNIVAMQIQTEVSEVTEWLEHEDKRVAPLISTRNVQTLAHVKNNTPFIIGGLIRNETRWEVNRLPLLSNVPILGQLFKRTQDARQKREDIIVLTPRVLEPLGPNRPLLPKDSPRFDFMNNKLFRNSYRLKADDIFDLGFIKENKQIQKTFRRAREFAQGHPDVAGKPPFDELRRDVLPGEDAVVVRMLYEIVKKLRLYEHIKLDKLIYFQKDLDKPAGFDVEFLEEALQSAQPGEPFFETDYPKNVLILRYDLEADGELSQITRTPVAEVEIKTVNGRDEVEELWEKGNRIEEGCYHAKQAVLVLDNEDDIVRLKTAILVREIINVNDAMLNVKNFQVGRRIVIPQLREENERIFLIDHNVARYDYMTEYYYSAFRNKLQRYYEGIQSIIGQRGG